MKPVVILGVFRSGTSATTRALGLLGASMGPQSDMGKFWENGPMRSVNELLLEAFGGGWECPPVLPAGWAESPEARALLPQARATLAAEFGSAPVMVWKDPRTCITLPFWRQVFDEEPVVVFIHRHPVEVARSMMNHNPLTRGHAFAIWERYNADALTSSVGLPTVVISYPPLVTDPVATMTGLVDSLAGWGVALPKDPATTELELTTSRRHQQVDAQAVFDDPLATDSQRELFALLHELPAQSNAFAVPRAIPAPNPLSLELLELAAQARVSRRDALIARNELGRVAGSRRRLLQRLIDQTVPGRTVAPAPEPKPAAANPPSLP